MTTFGITMVKDEADIIQFTLEHMLTQVDAVVVADNNSTDGTLQILKAMNRADYAIYLIHDKEIAYYQSRKMTDLAAEAAKLGADWVVPFDADEFWCSSHGRIGDVLERTEAPVVEAVLYNHIATAVDDHLELNPFERMGWRLADAGEIPKVACRPILPVTIHQGNHGASYDHSEGTNQAGLLEVRHFPYRSPEQMIHKARNGAAAYAATDLPEYQGQHWRDYGRLDDAGLTAAFYQWFYSGEPRTDERIKWDPCRQR